MSKKFEILKSSIEDSIREFEAQSSDEQTTARLVNSIRSLSGVKESENMIEQAQAKVDDSELGQLLALTIDLYKKHMETCVTPMEIHIVEAIKYLINNPEPMSMLETMTKPEETKPNDLFNKADVPAAAGQVDQAVIEKNDDEEKGGTPVDTGVFHKEAKISSIPEGYVEIDETVFGLKKKYCFKESATHEDKTSRLYCRNTYSAQRPTINGDKGYVFYAEGKQIRVRDLIRLTRNIGAVPVDPADYSTEVSAHNTTTEESDQLNRVEEVNDSTIETTGNRPECKGSGIIKEDGRVMGQNNEQSMIRSINIDWLVNNGIPTNKYVLFSDGNVFDTWHKRYLKPQLQNRGTNCEALYFLLTNGNKFRRKGTTIKKETLRIKKDELMKKFG